MNSEIKIILSGQGIVNDLRPIGASISYGVNRIPVASVSLGPESMGLLCDFDAFRRKNSTLTVRSDGGCLTFDGIIDGLSTSQHPGGMNINLVLKHKFTLLNEVYPRLLGLNSGGTNVFAINQPFQINPTGLSGSNLLSDFQNIFGYIADGSLKLDSNVIDFIVNLCKLIVKSQTLTQTPTTAEQAATKSNALFKALRAADINKNNLAPTVLTLLDSIDTSYCSGMTLAANAANVADRIIRDTAFLQDTVFACLLKLIHEYGCCLVIGNSKAYILPEALFLKVPKIDSTHRGSRGSDYNIVMPSQYESFSFNDNGENTIKGVHVIEDPSTTINNIAGASSTGVISGIFLDPNPNVFGNIVVRTLPNFATTANAYAVGVGSAGIHKAISEQNGLITGKVSKSQALTALQQVDKTIKSNAIAPAQTFMNNWAQLEYCRLKYEDRSGSINTAFHNIFAPGAVGSLYTRIPGTYIDFYVYSVTHTFNVGAASHGSADTSVSFKCGRAGSSTSNGLDRLDMFDYGYTNSAQFCESFINNIS